MQIDWDVVGLGQKPDPDLAAELGCSISRVRHQREKRGIPIMLRVRPQVDWDTVGLGRRPDDVIASEFGVLVSYVGRQRRRRGIAPYRSEINSEAARAVRGICHGFYWLGLIAHRMDGTECGLPHCNAQACCMASFLVRGEAVAAQVCAEHGRRIEAWALSPDMTIANRELVAALRSSGGRLPGRLHGELGLG